MNMANEPMACRDIALRAFYRQLAVHNFKDYTGILSMHGLARLAIITGDDALVELAREHLLPFVRGEREFRCNFMNYLCGGNGTAYLFWQGKLPEAADAVRRYADEALHEAPRGQDGIYTMPSRREEGRLWIDVAFGVSPFLLYAGLAMEDEACVEEAFQQTRKMVELFRDPENGLLHQTLNFMGPGLMTQDHWSRGNGWGIHALADLARYLPEGDPRKAASEKMLTDLLEACLAVQDEDGVWHQEMPDHSSFVETSGTGLILYALGMALEMGLLPDSRRAELVHGLNGYMRYIALDGSVHNTCRGCCCPGDGSIEAYKAHPHPLNDSHAFGPVLMAFGQAHAIGIETIAPFEEA